MAARIVQVIEVWDGVTQVREYYSPDGKFLAAFTPPEAKENLTPREVEDPKAPQMVTAKCGHEVKSGWRCPLCCTLCGAWPEQEHHAACPKDRVK